MTLVPGTRLGPYEIVAALGAGGMGEVYKARDTRLDRIVAIKILSDTLAAEPQFRERFHREARAISQLTHPHICTLYDVGEQQGRAFLVMEHLEGETLQRRLEKGALPLDEALRIAIQIADALSAAHRRGIVHRDLKPGNVMLTKGGAKLLDFGLAKATAPGGTAAVGGVSMLPTTPPNVTMRGTILGTFQYMAPEQLEGQDADARTDLFAFGAVVYEMVTGKKTFEGKSQASLISAIMSAHPPPVSSLAPLAPALLDHLVERCLTKDPEARWQSAEDLRGELAWIANNVPPTTASTSVPLAWRRTAALVSIITLAGAVGVGLGVAATRRAPPATRVVRLGLLPELGSTFTNAPIAGGVQAGVSPDGRYVAFVASTNGTPRLWVRALDGVIATPLPETDDAYYPFWSPDSRALGYFARGKLRRIDVTGGGAQTLATAPFGRGGTWNPEGVILFCPTSGSGLMRVPAGGGDVEPATSLAAGNRERVTAEYWPSFLPDGRHFLLFALAPRSEDRGVYIGTLGSRDTKRLADIGTMASFAGGYLFFVRQGTLVAQRFDLDRLQLSGDATAVAEHVSYSFNFGYAAFSVSQTGMVTYSPPPAAGQLTWFERSGVRGGAVGAPATYTTPELSPDGSRFMVAMLDPPTGRSHVWLFDLTRSTNSRLTLDPAADLSGIWSPDGRTLAFSSDRSGLPNLYQKPAVGIGEETPLFSTPDRIRYPTDWTRDGRALVYQEGTTGGYDLLLLRLDGNRPSIPLLQSASNEAQGRLSPNGRWIAYISDESSRMEVYVRLFPPTARSWKVSTDGGSQPAWRGDGSELYYVTTDGKMMAVSVNPTAPEFDTGVPHALFDARTPEVSAPYPWYYAVTKDGQRFLVNTVNPVSLDAPLTVLFNWDAAMKK